MGSPTYSSRWNISTARPIDARCRHQRLEELELRRAGRGDDKPRPAFRRDDVAQHARGVARRGAAHRRPIDVGFTCMASQLATRTDSG